MLRKLNKGGRCYVQLRNRIDYEFFDVFFVERKTKRAEFENLLELPKMDEIPDFYGVWNAVLEKHKNHLRHFPPGAQHMLLYRRICPHADSTDS